MKDTRKLEKEEQYPSTLPIIDAFLKRKIPEGLSVWVSEKLDGSNVGVDYYGKSQQFTFKGREHTRKENISMRHLEKWISGDLYEDEPIPDINGIKMHTVASHAAKIPSLLMHLNEDLASNIDHICLYGEFMEIMNSTTVTYHYPNHCPGKWPLIGVEIFIKSEDEEAIKELLKEKNYLFNPSTRTSGMSNDDTSPQVVQIMLYTVAGPLRKILNEMAIQCVSCLTGKPIPFSSIAKEFPPADLVQEHWVNNKLILTFKKEGYVFYPSDSSMFPLKERFTLDDKDFKTLQAGKQPTIIKKINKKCKDDRGNIIFASIKEGYTAYYENDGLTNVSCILSQCFEELSNQYLDPINNLGALNRLKTDGDKNYYQWTEFEGYYDEWVTNCTSHLPFLANTDNKPFMQRTFCNFLKSDVANHLEAHKPLSQQAGGHHDNTLFANQPVGTSNHTDAITTALTMGSSQ